MTVQYFTGQYPWWDDNSLSKPSKTLFTNSYINQTDSWTTLSNFVITDFEYDSAIIQWNGLWPNNSNTYFRISLDGNSWFYFFINTITFDNLSDNPTTTIMLRLDKWGSCVANMTSDFSTWNVQVLAVNKEVNLYAFWGYAYKNLSSYTFFKKVYPQHQQIKTIKYGDNQWPYYEQNTNENNEGIQTNGNYYYYYKINFLVSAFNNTPGATTSTKLNGNYKDYYTTQQTYTDTQLDITTKLDSWAFTEQLPFVSFSPVVSWVESNYINEDVAPVYFLVKWSIPLLLSFSTDKDIGLIQLPFCLSNKGLNCTYEGNVTDNYWLTTGTANYEAWSGGYWELLHNDSSANSYGITWPTYFINANGITINDTYGYQEGQVNRIEIDSSIFSLLIKNGWNDFISSEPWSFTSGEYQLSPFFLMYPYLWNFYSLNWNYMGQQVSYNLSYVNNVFNLWPIINSNGITNSQTVKMVFTANYPNISLNFYAQDNVIGSSNTPIGQINLSTAQLPNTTNPQATFLTNEHKIINNASTLKNLDIATASLSYLGGLGLNSLLNPLSLFTGAVNFGLDMDKINLNYSNSFGSAKQYELAHQNTLQTAGDNLGYPDNLLTFYQLVPALNDIQTMIGDIDKYGYPYNQWDRFNNLFGNYYHNYIKISQNADVLIYLNCPLLVKSWQSYLIEQLTQGVVIWEHPFANGIQFVDSWQLYNDCMNNKENYWNIQCWDTHYNANFKAEYNISNLTLEQPIFKEPIITSPKKETPLNQKETTKNKELKGKEHKIGWKKL